MTSETAAVAIERLHVTATNGLGSVMLVGGLDLRVPRKHVLGIVGETGAGKTVSMRALLGLLPRGLNATGRAQLGGGEWVDIGLASRMREFLGTTTGIVLQNPVSMFDPVVRVKHQLTEGVVRKRLASRRAALERAERLLDAMGFDEPSKVLELYPHQLSGGMSQRAAIAMALMPRPLVLVVDEPTSALDAHIRVEVLTLLRNAVLEQRSALILVSHDLGLVSHFCDSIVVMYAGYVVEAGEASDVLSNPSHPYTRALLACSPSLDLPPRSPLAHIEGSHPRPAARPAGCVFAPRCPVAFSRCRTERPENYQVGTRTVACFLAQQTHARDHG